MHKYRCRPKFQKKEHFKVDHNVLIERTSFLKYLYKLITKIVSFLKGFVKEVDNSGCCPLLKVVCKKDLCSLPKECPQYHLLKTQQLENSCCPLYTCEPPKNKCIFETEYVAAELGGERRLSQLESQKLLKNANETWKDGPCRQCKCAITSLGK